MLTFSSDAYENIVMFDKIGKQLLVLMGNSGTVPGALLANELPAALSNLESGIKHTPPVTSEEDEDDEPKVSLAHRAIPLINMLKSAIKQDCNVMWK